MSFLPSLGTSAFQTGMKLLSRTHARCRPAALPSLTTHHVGTHLTSNYCTCLCFYSYKMLGSTKSLWLPCALLLHTPTVTAGPQVHMHSWSPCHLLAPLAHSARTPWAKCWGVPHPEPGSKFHEGRQWSLERQEEDPCVVPSR